MHRRDRRDRRASVGLEALDGRVLPAVPVAGGFAGLANLKAQRLNFVTQPAPNGKPMANPVLIHLGPPR